MKERIFQSELTPKEYNKFHYSESKESDLFDDLNNLIPDKKLNNKNYGIPTSLFATFLIASFFIYIKSSDNSKNLVSSQNSSIIKKKKNLENKLNLSNYSKITFNTNINNDGKIENFTCYYKKKGSKLSKMFCYNPQMPNEFISKKKQYKLERNLKKPYIYSENSKLFKDYMDKYKTNKAKKDIISSSLDYYSLNGDFKSVKELMNKYNKMKKIIGLK